MKRPLFEVVVFALGSAIIVATALVPTTAQIIPTEVVAQLLLILVLGGALLWGRNGGFVTALIAIAIYVGMRYPVLQADGLSLDALTMIGSRALAYALVGIVGGELIGRVKYLFIRSDADVMIDPATRVFSASYAGRAIRAALGKHQRYGTVFSVITLTISPALWSGLTASRMKALLRRVASFIRNDLRLVDDVSYRGNGGFIIILPETEHVGASAVVRRLRAGVVAVLGCDAAELTLHSMTAGVDDAQLESIASALEPTTAADSGTTAAGDSSEHAVPESRQPRS